MNQLMEIPLHAGPEMERAINRTDFFRLFKSVCRASGFDNFVLIQQVDRGGRFDPTSSFHLSSIPDQERPALARALTEDKGAVLSRMQTTATPFTSGFSMDTKAGDALPTSDHCLLVIPLHSTDLKRYWLLLDGLRAAPGRRELAELMLDCMRIFSRFHEKILAGDASSQLTAREIEVVRWTSEGKTSAEIAIILGLSEHTVISHITSSARKLNAVNRVHMIAIAVRRGIVT
ncbi:helix-turn-helix transcriptional regulator [Rhizobium sp.]